MKNKKGVTRESSLTKNIYFSDNYFNKYQLFSLSEQINLLYKYSKLIYKPKILEIGKGNGFVSDFYKKANFYIKTFDINKNLNPDILGNILELNKLIDFKPDLILCAEVLEHIEFNSFKKILEELSIASNSYVIITLPEFKKFFGLNIQIRTLNYNIFSIPLFIKTRHKKKLGSGHFWEIDYDNDSKRKNIEKIIRKYFIIIEQGRFHSNPYHNYYVLKKI
ncbi:MAG: hypothetical protein KAI02_01130 [Gammaproteobacteria bacterium]|nr:hypothetical protein [Gammaproteobacteria bacterium]